MTAPNNNGLLIDVRKLAALDIAFHGPKLIVAEFGAGVFCFTAWGLYTLIDGMFRHSPGAVVWGAYLLSLAMNYMPLLRYAAAIARHGSAREESAGVLAHKYKYGLQSLLLLVPLFVPALAIVQEMKRKGAAVV